MLTIPSLDIELAELCSQNYKIIEGDDIFVREHELCMVSDIDEDFSVVSFRGTVDIHGWLSNARVAPQYHENYSELGLVHRGFADAADKLFIWVKDRVEKKKEVVLTGHSRGGAIATLIAWRLHKNNIPITQVVTFGEPKSITDPSTYNSVINHIRYIHKYDPVPYFPGFTSLRGYFGINYSHVGQQIWLNEPSWSSAFYWLWKCGAVGSVKDVIDDHYMESYINALNQI